MDQHEHRAASQPAPTNELTAEQASAKIAELERCCAELSDAVLKLHSVLESQQKQIAKLEVEVQVGRACSCGAPAIASLGRCVRCIGNDAMRGFFDGLNGTRT